MNAETKRISPDGEALLAATAEQIAESANCSAGAIEAWDAYSEASRELCRIEIDPTAGPRARCDAALLVNRTFRAWQDAMRPQGDDTALLAAYGRVAAASCALWPYRAGGPLASDVKIPWVDDLEDKRGADEDLIMKTTATTVSGVIAQLWTVLGQSFDHAAGWNEWLVEAAALNDRQTILARFDQLDVVPKFIVQAVRGLQQIAVPDPATAHRRDRWNRLEAIYLAAKAEADAFDAIHIDPGIDTAQTDAERHAACDAIPRSIWEQTEVLLEARHATEDPLMDFPSPDPIAFARKFLIAYGDKRDADCWNDMLEAEAKAIVAGGPAGPDTAEWDAELARFQPAWDAWNTSFDRMDEAPLGSAERQARETEWAGFAAEGEAARRDLMAVPAPHLAALAKKMEVGFIDTDGEDDFTICLKDAMRLAGMAPAKEATNG